jgi:hypothetical protein
MAIQTRQQASGRKIGLWRIVGATVGTIAVSATLVAGGLGWQRGHAPQAGSAAQVVVGQTKSSALAKAKYRALAKWTCSHHMDSWSLLVKRAGSRLDLSELLVDWQGYWRSSCYQQRSMCVTTARD